MNSKTHQFAWLVCFLLLTQLPMAAEEEAQSWEQNGKRALAAGDYITAEADFEKAVALDPSAVNYVIDLATAFQGAGQFLEGERTLQTAVAKFADHGKQEQLWAALADLQTAWGRSLRDEYSYDDAIQHFLAAFEIDKIHRSSVAGPDLYRMAGVYARKEDHELAIKFYDQALDWNRRTKNRVGEAQSLRDRGDSYAALSQYDQALSDLNQAVLIFRELHDQMGEALALFNIGKVYEDKSDYRRAIAYYEQVIPFLTAANAQSELVTVLASLGGAYGKMSRYDKAAEVLERALPLARRSKNRLAEQAILNDLGNAYGSKGKYDKAAQTFREALTIAQEINDRSGQEAALGNLATLYMDLNQFADAVPVLEQALVIGRELKDLHGEATTLANLGIALSRLDQDDKALGYLEEAIAILEKMGDRPGEAVALNNVSSIYDKRQQSEKAMAALERALELSRRAGDLSGESMALDNLGSRYSVNGKFDKAILYHQRALAVARAAGDPRAEGGALASLMTDYRLLREPRQAIFYGKLSIAAWQKIRQSTRTLGRESQQSYINSVADIYRELAGVLIAQGRISEAQDIIGLLKEEELFDFVQRDAAQIQPPLAPRLSAEENTWGQVYQQSAEQLAASTARRNELLAKSSLTPDEKRELATLDKTAEAAMAAFQKALSELTQEIQRAPQSAGRVAELQESEGLMQDLQELGSGAVVLFTVAGEEKYWVTLITPELIITREYPIGRAQLEEKIKAFLKVLGDPKSDPVPLASELYQIVVGPIAADLEAAHAQTLMWSLDGLLRYLPMAALYDGRQYLVERYRMADFTIASRTRLKDAPAQTWTVLGLGVSKAKPGFQALPSVPQELHDIVREGNNSNSGLLPGHILLDEAFTEDRLKDLLRVRYPVVHIASHFDLEADDDSSFLLLGDGSHLTLAQLLLIPNLFAGIDLLTLSACQTGLGVIGADGKGIDSFGALAQRKGAKAIIATLWPVADESTKLLMEKFYELHQKVSKAEALQQAQLALLSKTAVDGHRASSFAHPYFWAPFILIGNWR